MCCTYMYVGMGLENEIPPSTYTSKETHYWVVVVMVWGVGVSAN